MTTAATVPARWRGLGIDVGGTKIAAAVVDATGTPHEPVRLPTPAADGPGAVLDTMAEAARTALSNSGTDMPSAVGVSTGGVVDSRTGMIVSATDLLPGWAGTDVAGELSGRLGGVPVSVDNDGNALALGEQLFGAARGLDEVLLLAVGTGIAGALVHDGRLTRGSHHTRGELGHLPVSEANRPCSCGRSGHLEAVAAGPAIEDAYRRACGTEKRVPLHVVARRAADGDLAARRALTGGASVLGRTLGGLTNLWDPQAVVIGGGVVSCGDLYWQPLSTAFRAELLPGLADVALKPASLGPLSAVVGAAALPLALL
ncbi:ROK family protein [Streptomyces griseoluteus]|uniref:ROK family protein n=1 Tax=Streptomyces griseoluteus TaxID=29306 RepID=UPI0036F9A46A